MSIKPIHKFNGGRGATLCHKCSVIITEGHTDFLYCKKCDEDSFLDTLKKDYKYILRRSDKLEKMANEIAWIEWDEHGMFKNKYDVPEVGRSLILDGNHLNYTWLTTPIKEILEHKENFIKFTTRNSSYELHTII